MNYLSYRIELCKLTRKRDRESKIFYKEVEEVKKKNDPVALDEVYQTESFDLRSVDENISSLVTKYLASKANQKFLPVPPMNDKDGFWEQGHVTREWYLTNKGITEVRKLIREDSKESRESVAFWVGILFGLLGLIIGLISVLNRK